MYRRLGNSLEFASFVNKVVVSEEGKSSGMPPNLSTTNLIRLAAPSVPSSALDAVVERLEAGDKVTRKMTDEIIAQAKAEARR